MLSSSLCCQFARTDNTTNKPTADARIHQVSSTGVQKEQECRSKNATNGSPTGETRAGRGSANPSAPKATQHATNAKCSPRRPKKKTPDQSAIATVAAQLHKPTEHTRIIAAQLLAETEGGKPLTEKAVGEMCDCWKRRGLSAHTRHHKHRILRHLLKEAAAINPDLCQVAAAVPRLPNGPVRNITASPAEIDLLLDNAHEGMQLAILLCHDSGLRVSEALRICPQSFTGENQITFLQKGNRERTTSITARTKALMDTSDPTPTTPYVTELWPTNGNTHSAIITRRTVEAAWRRLKRRLHMRPELHIHDLRHTIATAAYEQTKDLRIAQGILGHDSIATTARYIAARKVGAPQNLLELITAESKWTPR